MNRLRCAVLVFLFALAGTAAVIGPDGQAYEKIVIASDAPDSVRFAAGELKAFLSKAGLAELPVATAAASGEAAIFLGNDHEADGLPSDGSVYARRIAVIGKEFRKGASRLTRMQKAGMPVLTAKRLAKAADIDATTPMRFYGVDADYGDPPTWVYGGYDRRCLTFKFICYEPEMSKVRTKSTEHDDGGIWEDDGIEIFVCPNPEDKFHGYQLIVNLAGVLMDGEWKNHDVLDKTWESNASVRVTKEPNRWVAEVSIPFASLGVADVTFADDMLLEFYRMRNAGKGGETFVWAPTGKPRHFEPSNFGRIRFEKHEE